MKKAYVLLSGLILTSLLAGCPSTGIPGGAPAPADNAAADTAPAAADSTT